MLIRADDLVTAANHLDSPSPLEMPETSIRATNKGLTHVNLYPSSGVGRCQLNARTARLSASGPALPSSVTGAGVGLTGAVPEEVEATVAVDHQVGEDRLGEARIVNADLMIFGAGLL